MEPILESLAREWMDALLFHKPVSSGVDGVLRTMGVVHLYGASGIHLYAVLSWIEFACKKVGRARGLPARGVRLAILALFLLLALWIWKLQGFSFSLFRPLCSILIRAILRESGVRVWIFAPLVMTLVLEYVLSIKTGLSYGAHHYYLAVGGSLVALSRGDAGRSHLRLHAEMAVYSWIPIALLDFFKDHLVSPWTPLLSLITIPPLTLFLYPCSLLALSFQGSIPEVIFSIWVFFFQALIRVLDCVPPVFSVGWDCALISLLLIGILKSARIPRAFGIGFFLIVIAGWRGFQPFSGPNQVVQLDVGQGDSALIQEGNHAELVDAGPVRFPGPEGWIRRLSRYGVTSLDGILLTHLDDDHAGGLYPLLSVVNAGCIEISNPHQTTKKGRDLEVWLKTLPEPPEIRSSGCILLSRVEWFRSSRHASKGNIWMGGISRRISGLESYLALGDGDVEQELEFEGRFSGQIKSSSVRIWKIGHHGSRFSSDLGFLRRIAPSELWISVGKRNPYRHPAREVLARLGLQKGEVRRTDTEGDLIYRARGSPW
ncbi:MAG: ComEC/Rec2 family competence protein [Bdellovibrionales bacterium]|nr:ComEC/Rec2 family competence protein [Bdellovibrionales bacterium]